MFNYAIEYFIMNEKLLNCKNKTESVLLPVNDDHENFSNRLPIKNKLLYIRTGDHKKYVY